MKKRHYFTLIQFTILIYCLFFIIGKSNTYAWFTSEIEASGKITNATTDDLLLISKEDVAYLKNCEISQKISVKNISKMQITIQLENDKKLLSPGESYKAMIKKAVSCEKTEVSYHLTGLNDYIDEIIREPLDQKKLLATVDKKEENEPSDKSKVTPNEKAEVKAPTDDSTDSPDDKTKEKIDSPANSGKNDQTEDEQKEKVKKHSSDPNTDEPQKDFKEQ